MSENSGFYYIFTQCNISNLPEPGDTSIIMVLLSSTKIQIRVSDFIDWVLEKKTAERFLLVFLL